MEKLDKKTFAIGVLSVSALVLLAANLVQQPRAEANLVVKDRDYQAVTARTIKGGDALYLTDNRTGLMAVFVYDPGRQALTPAAVRSVGEAFGAGKANTGAKPGRGTGASGR